MTARSPAVIDTEFIFLSVSTGVFVYVCDCKCVSYLLQTSGTVLDINWQKDEHADVLPFVRHL